MSDVKRYDPVRGAVSGEWMTPSDTGDYVLHSDYAALLSRLSEANSKLGVTQEVKPHTHKFSPLTSLCDCGQFE